MKILLVFLFGIVLTCQGVPVNEESDYSEDDGELEDAIEMNEPEIENEQNEAFGDDMSEYQEDGDNESDEEEDSEDDESDPAKKGGPAKKKSKKVKKTLKKLMKKFACKAAHRFCRTRTVCTINYKKGKKGAVCETHRFCVCSNCPKGKPRKCGYTEKKDKKGLTYKLECKCKK